MNKCTIRFIRDTESVKGDDVLTISEDDTHADMFCLKFKPCGWKSHNEFYMDRHRALDYIAGVLKTLPHDAEPFQYVQVDSALHPSVMYRVSDLYLRNVCYLIEDTVSTALIAPSYRMKSTA
jgi:hypothetical protein